MPELDIQTDPSAVAAIESAPIPLTFRRCRYGPMVFLPQDLFVGPSFLHYGEYSPAETETLVGNLRPGDVVVDVGAYIGALTIPFAKAVGPTGGVVAFEPQPFIFEVLCCNVVLNRLENVRLLNAASGAAPAEATIPLLDYRQPVNFGAIDSSYWLGGTKVPITPIDALNLPRCNLIKADVEMMELEVLRGAAATIAHFHPLLWIENDKTDAAYAKALVEHIYSLGYTPYWHIAELFVTPNFANNSTNIFHSTASFNLLCVPPGAVLEGNWPICRPDAPCWTDIPRPQQHDS